MSDKIEVKVTHQFRASAQRVYDAWLDPAKVRIWMKGAAQRLGLAGDIREVEIDPKVGGKFLFTDMRDGAEARHWGTYLELDRPKKIVFTWITDESEEADPGTVTLTLQPTDEGCLANITHVIDAKWADYIKQTKDGWNSMLQATDELLGD